MKIKSIRKLRGCRERFDMTVPSCKNFFANGILVHNCSIYSDLVHARSIDGRTHPSRNWVKNLHATIGHDIPDGWRVCGENVFAEHSILYEDLPSYFLVFAIYDEFNICLSWDETVEYAEVLGLKTVPVLYRGPFNEEAIRKLYTGKSVFGQSMQEGYVVRLAGKIPWRSHRQAFVKFVRQGHVGTNHHWMHKAVVKNGLQTESDHKR